MNKNNSIFGIARLCGVALWCISSFFLNACSSGSDDEPALSGPQLVSSTPADGAEVGTDGTLQVELTYDRSIRLAASAQNKLTAGEARVEGVFHKGAVLSIKLSGLQTDHNYTVKVPRGYVTGTDGAPAEAVNITFTASGGAVMPVDVKLCTPNPSPQAQKLYEYLVSIYGRKTLSSTMADVAWNLDEAELVNEATGKYPAIACMDYIHLAWEPADWNNYNKTEFIEKWWGENGLVAACWHWNVPCKEGMTDPEQHSYRPGNGEPDQWGNLTTAFRPKNVVMEGTWENTVARQHLETLCGYLKILQEKGIPVIWRPLHEAAGNIYEYKGGTAWFWWGSDGAQAYVDLWRFVYDYMTKAGLNNLIWVWTSQTGDEEFYPGDDYVDIVGRDIYGETKADLFAGEYRGLTAAWPQKMIALSECGSVADIPTQWNAGAKWLFFMPWYHYAATSLVEHANADKVWWEAAMKQEYVLSREDLPSFK